jgi:hypothetical protein
MFAVFFNYPCFTEEEAEQLRVLFKFTNLVNDDQDLPRCLAPQLCSSLLIHHCPLLGPWQHCLLCWAVHNPGL